MNILLTSINSKYIHQNLAIRILYAQNKDYKDLSWKEFTLKEESPIIAAYCSLFEVVAFSCYIWNITKTLQVAAIIKNINPNTKIILGGPEVSYDYLTLILNQNIDYIIPNEAETPFAQFLKYYPQIENIKGIVWKDKNEVRYIKNEDIFDVSQLANINPYEFDDENDRRNKIAYIEASRGCPYRCSYCLAGLDNKLRFLPIETVKSNLLFVMQHARVVKFLDRTFNANQTFAISILQFILDNNNGQTSFQFEIKADILQPEFIAFIQKHIKKGQFRFEIGIQTLNTRSNDSIQRRQDFENIRIFILSVQDYIDIHLDLIVGLPHDYWNDIKYSFEQVFLLFQPELQLGFLKFLKGTPIRQEAASLGYMFDNAPPYQIIESAYLTAQELEQIHLAEHVLDIYWNKKRGIHTLRYIAEQYSIFEYLCHLGKYFETTTGLHGFSVNDMYNNLFHFSTETFPLDPILPQLIAIDYYLQHKTRPAIRFLSELDKETKITLTEQNKLNTQKFRYVFHPLSFNLKQYIQNKVIEPSTDFLIVQFDGVNRAQLIYKQ